MKYIFLNTWHSGRSAELRAYIERHLSDTDVFCFQEASRTDQEAYSDLLKDYIRYEAGKTTDEVWYALATFVRRGLEVSEVTPLLSDELGTGLALAVTITSEAESMSVCSVHGVPYPGHKLDTAARLTQSKQLIEHFAHQKRVIIGGDFNLLPETESVQLFEDHGYRNLIQDYNIKTTRNHIAFEAHPNSPQYFADYVFVSPGVQLEHFEVPSDVVSDHQPLELMTRGQTTTTVHPRRSVSAAAL